MSKPMSKRSLSTTTFSGRTTERWEPSAGASRARSLRAEGVQVRTWTERRGLDRVEVLAVDYADGAVREQAQPTAVDVAAAWFTIGLWSAR